MVSYILLISYQYLVFDDCGMAGGVLGLTSVLGTPAKNVLPSQELATLSLVFAINFCNRPTVSA